MNIQDLIIRQLGLQEYIKTWEAMREFTDNRDAKSNDELWIVEHPPVFTQGLGGKPEHVLKATNIPIVHTDRGGQVTYHGPGQLMIYVLIDLSRLKIRIREFVSILEQSIIQMLSDYHIKACAHQDAPGVYVNSDKICSIGLKIRHGRTYHGLALNVNMDLDPFTYINPCGFKDLKMTQLKTLTSSFTFEDVTSKIIDYFSKQLHYKDIIYVTEKQSTS